LFLTLGLLVFPKQIIPFLGIGLLISVALIFVARPLGVFLSLIFFRFEFKEKLFISWVGLRGAVPIVLATYPLTAGIEKANTIFNLVFFISVSSVLLQGTSLPLIAKWLKLVVPVNLRKKSALDLELAWENKSIYSTILILPEFNCINKSIVDVGLPNTIVIAIIERENQFFIPEGSTKLLVGDKLYVMADDTESIDRLKIFIGSQDQGNS
jgi:cell volume regulation protein A